MDDSGNKDGKEECEMVTIDPKTVELDCSHTGLKSIENFKNLIDLEFLKLNWNLIKKIEHFHHFTKLRHLEMSDNQISAIENLDSLVHLE